MQGDSEDAWARLGREIRRAREARGHINMRLWAEMVGRSTRVLQGLERGERTGEKTLERVSDLLGWGLDGWRRVLAGQEPVSPGGDDAGFVRSGEGVSLSDESEAQLAERIRIGLAAMDEMRRRQQ